MRRLLGASAALRWALALGALLAGAAAAEITSIATLPGGSSGQIQYNNRGQFGGASIDTTTLAALPVSTGSIQRQLTAEEVSVAASTAAVALATTTNAANLAAEAAARLAQDLTIGASTAGVQVQITATQQSVATSTGAIATSTASLQAQLNATQQSVASSTGAVAASTSTLVRRAGDTMTGPLTVNAGVAVTSVTVPGGLSATSTGTVVTNLGVGGSPEGTRKLQIYFNANNNAPSYGDGAMRYLDLTNQVGFECGALYGGLQPAWCQSGNDFMGSPKPFIFQPAGGTFSIGPTVSPPSTSAFHVSGDASFTGQVQVKQVKFPDGTTQTSAGGGGTVTPQGTPQAGQIAVFQNGSGTVISTGPVAAAAWNGVNYQLWSASAPGVAYSTGAGGFHIAAATYVFRGLAYAVPDTNFSIVASTNAMVWWNPANFGNGNNGYTLYGLVDTSMATLSTFVVTGLVSDDIAVLLTTTTANSVPRFMDTVQHSPLPSVKVFEGGRFMPNQNSGETIFSDGYNCAATKIVFMSCIYNTAAEQPFLGPQYVYHDFFNSGGAAMFSFTVYNSSAGAANISAASVEVSRNNYRVNAGAAGVITVDSPAPTLISVAAGKYSTVSISTNYGGSASISVTLVINLPPGVTIVRGGYW
jgi:hypothetical protein